MELERAVAQLPPGCRAAFVLHDVEGYTHEEIGEHMGYTTGTSKSHVFRARRILRRLLSGAEVQERSHG
jgi:RNA polymerase sigma-70 factor (ECF subfamily)